MYYNNKSSFYIKQYGSKVAITTLSVLLVVSLSFIYYMIDINPYFTSNNVANNNIENVDKTDKNITSNNEVKEEVKKEESNNITPVPTVNKTESLKNDVIKTTEYFDNLTKGTFSSVCTVTSITDYNKITIETADSKIDARLIGVSIAYTNKSKYIDKLQLDLINKEVKVVFDTEKNTNGIYNVYLYISDSLYNADILKSGLATLESERTNIALTKTLGGAQAYARENKAGVWNK